MHRSFKATILPQPCPHGGPIIDEECPSCWFGAYWRVKQDAKLMYKKLTVLKFITDDAYVQVYISGILQQVKYQYND